MRAYGLRALLDTRSEAHASHGLEMRTELQSGDLTDELIRQLRASQSDAGARHFRTPAISRPFAKLPRHRAAQPVPSSCFGRKNPHGAGPARRGGHAMRGFRSAERASRFGLTFGFTTFFLSAIVLIPLAALVLMAASTTWENFLHVVLSPAHWLLQTVIRRIVPCALNHLVLGSSSRGRWCAIISGAPRDRCR